MARRYENGALRTAPPRRKDVGAYTAAEPSRDRGLGGRFTPGNRAAKRSGLSALIKRHLGADAKTEEVEQLYRDTTRRPRARRPVRGRRNAQAARLSRFAVDVLHVVGGAWRRSAPHPVPSGSVDLRDDPALHPGSGGGARRVRRSVPRAA